MGSSHSGDDPLSTSEVLAMEGSGFPLDNDDLEGEDEPVDLELAGDPDA